MAARRPAVMPPPLCLPRQQLTYDRRNNPVRFKTTINRNNLITHACTMSAMHIHVIMLMPCWTLIYLVYSFGADSNEKNGCGRTAMLKAPSTQQKASHSL